MQFQVKVENLSSILRKLNIVVPAAEVKSQFDKEIRSIQGTAQLKGFRKGFAPVSLIEQFYGNDIRHRLYHVLVDESFALAVKQEGLRTVGRAKIEAAEHQTGAGEHDHEINPSKDFHFQATVEIFPEITVKNYTGLSVEKETVEINDEHVEKVVQNLLSTQAELIPVAGGLALADGSESSRPVQKNDFADIQFAGGVVTEAGVETREDMKGQRLLEVGSGTFIPGFEDQVIGMRKGETKTFRVSFPADYSFTELAGKEAEFTVTVNELKEKKLPTLDNEFAVQMGYETVEDLRAKARDYLVRERTEESDQKMKSELLSSLITQNPFDVPQALIDGQTRALIQEWLTNLKEEGLKEEAAQKLVIDELPNLRKRAESQVRSSLILEAIAKGEKISVSSQDMDEEMNRVAQSMKVEKEKVIEFYEKNSARREDLEFRMRQERTLQFIIDKAKIKSVAAK